MSQPSFVQCNLSQISFVQCKLPLASAVPIKQTRKSVTGQASPRVTPLGEEIPTQPRHPVDAAVWNTQPRHLVDAAVVDRLLMRTAQASPRVTPLDGELSTQPRHPVDAAVWTTQPRHLVDAADVDRLLTRKAQSNPSTIRHALHLLMIDRHGANIRSKTSIVNAIHSSLHDHSQSRQASPARAVHTVTAHAAPTHSHLGCVNSQYAMPAFSHRMLIRAPLQMKQQQQQEHPHADPNMWRSSNYPPTHHHDESRRRCDTVSLTTQVCYSKQVDWPLTACECVRSGRDLVAPPIVAPGMGLNKEAPSSTWSINARKDPYVLTQNGLRVLCGVIPIPPGLGHSAMSQTVAFFDDPDHTVPPRQPEDQLHSDAAIIAIGGKHNVAKGAGHFQSCNRVILTSSYHSAHAASHCSGQMGNNCAQPQWATTMKGMELLLTGQGNRTTRSNCSNSKRNTFQATRTQIFEEMIHITKPEYYHVILDLMMHFDRIYQAQTRAANDIALSSRGSLKPNIEVDILRNCIPAVQLIMLTGNEKLVKSFSASCWLAQALRFLNQPLNHEGQLRVITPQGATAHSFVSQITQVPLRYRSASLSVEDTQFFFIDPQAISVNGTYTHTVKMFDELDQCWQHQVQILARILSSSFPFSTTVSDSQTTAASSAQHADDPDSSEENTGDDGMGLEVARMLSPVRTPARMPPNQSHTGATGQMAKMAVQPMSAEVQIPQFGPRHSESSDGADPDVMYGFPYTGPACIMCDKQTDQLDEDGQCFNCPFVDVDKIPGFLGLPCVVCDTQSLRLDDNELCPECAVACEAEKQRVEKINTELQRIEADRLIEAARIQRAHEVTRAAEEARAVEAARILADAAATRQVEAARIQAEATAAREADEAMARAADTAKILAEAEAARLAEAARIQAEATEARAIALAKRAAFIARRDEQIAAEAAAREANLLAASAKRRAYFEAMSMQSHPASASLTYNMDLTPTNPAPRGVSIVKPQHPIGNVENSEPNCVDVPSGSAKTIPGARALETNVLEEARSYSKGHTDLVAPVNCTPPARSANVLMYVNPLERISGSAGFLAHQFGSTLSQAGAIVAAGDAVGVACVTQPFHGVVAFCLAQSTCLFLKHGDTACPQCSEFTAVSSDIPLRNNNQVSMYSNADNWYEDLSLESKAFLLQDKSDVPIAKLGYRPKGVLHLIPSPDGTINYQEGCAVGSHVCAQCSTLAFASAHIPMTAGDIIKLTNMELSNILRAALRSPSAIAAMDIVCPKAQRRESTPIWQTDGFLKVLMHSARVCPFNLAGAPAFPYAEKQVGTHPPVHPDFWRIMSSIMAGPLIQLRPAFGLTQRDTLAALGRVTATLKRAATDHPDPPRTKGGRDNSGRPTSDHPQPPSGRGASTHGKGSQGKGNRVPRRSQASNKPSSYNTPPQ